MLSLKETLSIPNNIPGGLAKGKTPADLAKKYNVPLAKVVAELKKGTKVEREHTSDSKIAIEIAMDHLWEDLYYYEKLATIEK